MTTVTIDWWQSIDDECPITLEPLKELSYPPFLLHQNYFDGIALASYAVSRGVFANPLTRQPMTMGDARRLDEYLQQHGNRSVNVSVAEALGLHSSIQVIAPRGDDHRRAMYLRSEATAALCGLFVYRQNRRSSRVYTATNTTNTTNQQKQTIPRSGFHLYDKNGAPRQASAVDHMTGFTLIDDDEQRVVDANEQDWSNVQKAFPKLSTNDVAVTFPPADAEFLLRIHKMAQELQKQEQQKQSYIEQGKTLMMKEAQRRKEQTQIQQQQYRQLNEQAYIQKQQDQAALAVARQEIQEWREQQWQDLYRFSHEQCQLNVKKDKESTMILTRKDTELAHSVSEPVADSKSAEQAASAKAATLAAKRKRAKERKREHREEAAKKAEERATLAKLEEDRKKASLQCAGCHQGILDCGFDKGGHKFCSAKCARTGPVASS